MGRLWVPRRGPGPRDDASGGGRRGVSRGLLPRVGHNYYIVVHVWPPFSPYMRLGRGEQKAKWKMTLLAEKQIICLCIDLHFPTVLVYWIIWDHKLSYLTISPSVCMCNRVWVGSLAILH